MVVSSTKSEFKPGPVLYPAAWGREPSGPYPALMGGPVGTLWISQADISEQLGLVSLTSPVSGQSRRNEGSTRFTDVTREMILRLDELSEETALLKYDLSALEQENRTLAAERDELREGHYRLMQHRDTVEAERDLLSLELKLLDSQRDELEERLETLQAERMALIEQRDALGHAHDELARQCDSLAHDRDRLLEAAKEAITALSRGKAHIREQSAEVMRLRAEGETLRGALMESASAVHEAHRDVRSLHELVEQVMTQIAALARSPLALPLRSRLRSIIAA